MKTSKFSHSSSKMAAKNVDSPSTECEKAGFISAGMAPDQGSSTCLKKRKRTNKQVKSAGDENMEKEANTVSSGWSQLPPLLIQKIYSLLDRQNQNNMSLVCQSWADQYGSASLWRSMILSLPKYEYNIEESLEVTLARKYGSKFQHVEIICNCYDSDLNESDEEDAKIAFMWEELHLFLQTLMVHSQLLSLKLILDRTYSFGYLEDVDKIMFDTLFEVIKNLILSQNELQSLQFENCRFKASTAVVLFRIICTKNTLKELSLLEFVESPHGETLENAFEDVSDLENLMNLEEWTVDYSQIFENIIKNFYEYGNQSHMTEKKWKLKIMNLWCYGSDRVNYLGISSSEWQYMRNVCPQLKIDLVFYVASDITKDLDLFITRYMPITSVEFVWREGSESSQQICTALQHFVECGINENLEELFVAGFSRNTNLASDLKNFLKVSPKLRMLSLDKEPKIEELQILFNDWLENRPISLERVDVLLRSALNERFTADDLKSFSDLENEFVPALKKLGLNLSLKVY